METHSLVDPALIPLSRFCTSARTKQGRSAIFAVQSDLLSCENKYRISQLLMRHDNDTD